MVRCEQKVRIQTRPPASLAKLDVGSGRPVATPAPSIRVSIVAFTDPRLDLLVVNRIAIRPDGSSLVRLKKRPRKESNLQPAA